METKHYTIKQAAGGRAVFLCDCCDHRISTKDFDRRNGNVRTQAAAAMHRHYVSEHKMNTVFMAKDRNAARERVWRMR